MHTTEEQITIVLACVYFAAFAAIHIGLVVLTRRFDRAAPEEAVVRVRFARGISTLHAAKLAWFAILFTVSAVEVVAVTPHLPLMEIIVLYGGIIGIVTGGVQAASWWRAAAKVRRADLELRSLAIVGGEVMPVHMLDVWMPRVILEQMLAGESLSTADAAALRAANQSAMGA